MASDVSYYGEIGQLALGFKQQEEFFHFVQANNALLFSAAFDNETADFLDAQGALTFKTASMDCNNVPPIRHVARKNKPIFLSTGMADMEEVALAVNTIRAAGNGMIILMHRVLKAGTVLTEADCVPLRPARGASVARWDAVIGKKLTKPLAQGEPIGFSSLE